MTPAVEQMSPLNRPQPAVSEGRSFWRAAALLLGVVSLAKGVRLPSRWAATQALIDYDHGVVRRGLFGSTLGHWFQLERYSRFTVVAYLLLAIFGALLVRLTLKSHAFTRFGVGEPAAIFFSSFAITYFAHLVGYLDICLGIVATGLLLLSDSRMRFLAAMPLCVLALLLHEMFLVVLLPAVLFSFVADAFESKDGHARRVRLTMAGSLLVLSLAAFCWVAMRSSMNSLQIQAISRELAAKADFPVRQDVFAVLTRTMGQNMRAMGSLYLHSGLWRARFAVALLAFAPVLVMLGIAIRRCVTTLYAGRNLKVMMSAAMLAALSPFAMHLVAFDNGRWNALACLSSFLVLLILCRSLPLSGIQLPAGYRTAAVLIMACSMATGEGLMDEQGINTFPFFTLMRAGVHGLRDGWQPPAY